MPKDKKLAYLMELGLQPEQVNALPLSEKFKAHNKGEIELAYSSGITLEQIFPSLAQPSDSK